MSTLKYKLSSCKTHLTRVIKANRNYLFRRKKILKYIEKKYAIPEKLYIECTNLCNARCGFCYYKTAAKTMKPLTMSMSNFHKVLQDYINMGGQCLSLTPTIGDPLMDELFNERIMAVDVSAIRKIEFYTNLINCDDEVIETLENIKNTQIGIYVSIAGFDAESYAKYMGVNQFGKVKRNLQRLSEINNPCLNVTVILRDYILSDYHKGQFVSYLDGLGFNYNTQREFDTWGGLVEKDIKLLSELQKMKQSSINRIGPCAVTYSKPVVTVDMKLKLCECGDVLRETVVGDLNQNTLKGLWEGENARKFRESMFDYDKWPKTCKKCTSYVSIFELS